MDKNVSIRSKPRSLDWKLTSIFEPFATSLPGVRTVHGSGADVAVVDEVYPPLTRALLLDAEWQDEATSCIPDSGQLFVQDALFLWASLEDHGRHTLPPVIVSREASRRRQVTYMETSCFSGRLMPKDLQKAFTARRPAKYTLLRTDPMMLMVIEKGEMMM